MIKLLLEKRSLKKKQNRAKKQNHPVQDEFVRFNFSK